ncbi:MAG: hypothetical protein K940chlam1_01294, partial [Candidatus Anoxychlamydiales bacterium]|nr:hypothetical protein [Candidatus Anoxychlamydiales bacterium]
EAEFDREEEQLRTQHEKELAKIRADSAIGFQQLQDDFDTRAKQTQRKQAELDAEVKLMEAQVKAQLDASNTQRDELLDTILNAPEEELNGPFDKWEKKIVEIKSWECEY